MDLEPGERLTFVDAKALEPAPPSPSAGKHRLSPESSPERDPKRRDTRHTRGPPDATDIDVDALDDGNNKHSPSVGSSDGDVDKLHETIGRLRDSLSLCTGMNASGRVSLLDDLASMLLASFELQGGRDVLAESIVRHRELLELYPLDDPGRGSCLNSLANALKLDFEHHGNHAALQEAILRHHEALAAHDPDRVLYTNNLANTLIVNFEATGDLVSLQKALKLLRGLAGSMADDDPLRGWVLLSLATALDTCFEQNGDVNAMREGIELHRKALSLHGPGHDLRRASLNNLAAALQTQFEQCGDFAALTESIARYREALQLSSDDHPDRPSALDNLAGALQTNFEQYGDFDSLSEAIDLHREALGLFALDEPGRLSALNNLSSALRHLYHQTSNDTALQEATNLLRDTLKFCGVSNPDRWSILGALANARQDLYEERQDRNALAEAVELHREALELCPPGHVGRSAALHNLGTALASSFEGSHDAAILEEALRLHEDALHLRPSGHPQRTESLAAMAAVYFAEGTSLFDLSTGLRYMEELLSQDTVSVRYRLLHAGRRFRNLEHIWADAISSDVRASLEDRVLELYTYAIRLLPRAASFTLDHASRLGALSYAGEEMCRYAAVRAMQLGRGHLALELLETGRGVFWSQALRLRDTTFANLPSEDCAELQRILRQLDQQTQWSDETGDYKGRFEKRLELGKRADALIAQIRLTQPGLSRLFEPLSFHELLDGLPDGFVVMTVSTSTSHSALIIAGRTGDTRVLQLDSVPARSKLQAMVASLPRGEKIEADTARTPGVARPMHKSTKKKPLNVEDILTSLWHAVVKPIIDVLQLPKATDHQRPRVFWCSSGTMAALPLHAAGMYRPDGSASECASDYMVSSYIPTISALKAARAGYQPVRRDKLTALLVAEANAPGFQPIGSVRDESRIIRALLQAASVPVVNDVDTTFGPQDIIKHLPDAALVHMATHGEQTDNPLRSRFALRDGNLTIADLLRLRLPRAVLAFLSACETARGSDVQPDQVLHLATSMLFCGFRTVIATLWAMQDDDGPKVAQSVYESLLKRDALALDDVPYALDEAVRRLRNEGVPAANWSTYIHVGG